MSRKDAQVDILRSVTLFSACNDKELRKLASLCSPVPARAGAVLAKEGLPGLEFYAIAGGKAKVTRKGKTLATIGPGDFFGEMSLLDPGPRTATVKAETDMDLYVLEPREFWTLIDEHPAVAKKILKALARRLREVDKVSPL